jgi:Domain of unknown function (DUF4189)
MRIIVLVVMVCIPSPSNADWAIAEGSKPHKNWSQSVNWGASSKFVARMLALRECRAGGARCKIVAAGSHGTCVAFGLTGDFKHYKWASHVRRDSAELSVERQCEKRGTNCIDTSSFCDK